MGYFEQYVKHFFQKMKNPLFQRVQEHSDFRPLLKYPMDWLLYYYRNSLSQKNPVKRSTSLFIRFYLQLYIRLRSTTLLHTLDPAGVSLLLLIIVDSDQKQSPLIVPQGIEVFLLLDLFQRRFGAAISF